MIENKYMYHYTLTENLDDILKHGLIPRKKPNSHYKNGSNGIFLTIYNSLYKANLPQELMDTMNDYYDNIDNYDEPPIVRLKIDVSKLNLNDMYYDDDYKMNSYGWNKAKTHKEKIIECIDMWGALCYLNIIPKEYIINYDYDYNN